MQNILIILQIVSALLLSVCILIQAQGTGLGRAWGGGGEFYRGKRGVEKIVFKATIVLAAIFLSVSLLAVVL